MTVHLTRVRLDGVVVEQPVAVLRLGDGLGLAESNGIVTLTLGSLQQASAEAVTNKFETLQLTNPLDEIYGGTGNASYAAGDLLVASSSHTLIARAVGATGTFLRASSSGEPTYSSLSLPSSGSSGTILFISSTNAVTAVHVEDALRATFSTSSTGGTWAPNADNGVSQRFTSTAVNLTVTLPSNLASGQVLNLEIYVAGFNVTFASTDFRTGSSLTWTAYDTVWASIQNLGQSRYACHVSGTTST